MGDAVRLRNGPLNIYIMKKIIYNACYGQFMPSFEAIRRYYELKDDTLVSRFIHDYIGDGFYRFTKDTKAIHSSKNCIYHCGSIYLLNKNNKYLDEYECTDKFYDKLDLINPYKFKDLRTDPIFIQVVEELEDEASGEYSDLRIKEIKDKYYIFENDGYEIVETPETIKWLCS